MKPKDIIGLVFALALLVGVSYYFISQGKPQSHVDASQVEVVTALSGNLDSNGLLNSVESKYKVRDYKVPVNINSGLGNSAPFSQ